MNFHALRLPSTFKLWMVINELGPGFGSTPSSVKHRCQDRSMNCNLPSTIECTCVFKHETVVVGPGFSSTSPSSTKERFHDLYMSDHRLHVHFQRRDLLTRKLPSSRDFFGEASLFGTELFPSVQETLSVDQLIERNALACG